MTDLSRGHTSPLSTGHKIIRFIESYCVVPEGDHVGKPVVLADFQKKFIIEVYDNPHITDTAILSIARKNAKTGTIAFLVLAHLVGPVAMQNARLISGAQSREQASEVYNLASKTVLLSPKLRDLVRTIPSAKKLIGLPMNTEYQAISAEGKTAHGKSPLVAILDEVGQVQGPKSDFVDAITTAQGAYTDPLLIYISTQAATDADMFSLIIDDAKKHKPPKTVCHVYEAEADCSVLDEKEWAKANPALGLFRSEKDMKKQADKASRMPSFESTFRNLNLNQRVATNDPFVSAGVWKLCSTEPPLMNGRVLYGGLDLSAKLDLTSAVFVEVDGDYLNVWPFFWCPEDGLLEREDRDKAPYSVWVKQGFLRTTPGNSINYGVVAKDIAMITAGADLNVLNFDRWRIDVLQKDCQREGVELPLAPFGQGYKDISPALDLLEEYLVGGRVRHGMHPVLTWCAANAIVVQDPAGNRKLDKSKSNGRIDGMVALTMATGGAAVHEDASEPTLMII